MGGGAGHLNTDLDFYILPNSRLMSSMFLHLHPEQRHIHDTSCYNWLMYKVFPYFSVQWWEPCACRRENKRHIHCRLKMWASFSTLSSPFTSWAQPDLKTAAAPRKIIQKCKNDTLQRLCSRRLFKNIPFSTVRHGLHLYGLHSFQHLPGTPRRMATNSPVHSHTNEWLLPCKALRSPIGSS